MEAINIKLLLCAVFLLSLVGYSKGQQITVRGGLPNFYSKVEAKEKVCISYFGGSITAQPGWRVQSLNYLRKKYPDTQFMENNATIGGTGSELGVLRMGYDVLRVKSDLLFVEFAVNDSYSEEKDIVDSMEGIVRKHGSNTRIVIFVLSILLMNAYCRSYWLEKRMCLFVPWKP